MLLTQNQTWEIFFDKPNKPRFVCWFSVFSGLLEFRIFFTEIYLNTSDHPMLWGHSSFWLNRFYSLWCIRIQNHECLAKGFLCKFFRRNCSLWCLMQHICEFAVLGNQFQNKYSHVVQLKQILATVENNLWFYSFQMHKHLLQLPWSVSLFVR